MIKFVTPGNPLITCYNCGGDFEVRLLQIGDQHPVEVHLCWYCSRELGAKCARMRFDLNKYLPNSEKEKLDD